MVEEKKDGDPSCCQRLKNLFALTKPEATPLEWSTVMVTLIGLFGGCYSITFIFPFLPEMVLFFGYKEEDKGYYAGLVASCIFLGRFFSSYFWGWLSDRKGRRPVAIICLLMMSIVNIAFGFSTDLTSAMIFRLIAGATNGLVGVTKSILCDISDDTNQAAGMSTIALSWGLGIVTGPLISGYIASPAKKYPQHFSQDGVFGRYPYLLASIIASVMCFLPLIMTFFLLPETRHRKKRIVLISEVKLDTIEESHEELVEMLPKGPSHSENMEGTTQKCSGIVMSNTKTAYVKNKPDRSETSQLTCEVDVLDADKNHSCEKDVQLSTKTKDDPKVKKKRGCWDYVKEMEFYTTMKIPGVCISVGLYSLLSFCVIGADEVFTVWASTDIQLHGLGFGTEEIGIALGISTLPLLFIQVYIFPAAEAKFGSKKTFEVACLFLIFCLTTVAALRILLHQHTIMWVCLLLSMGITKICSVTCFSAVGILMNNSVPPEKVGVLNGIAMTFAALFRGLAPTVGGSLFAWSITSGVKIGFPFDVNLVFIIFGSVFLASNVLCSVTPQRLNHQHKARLARTR